MNNTVIVWLEEEYGYRYWRWDTGMSESELVAWWSSLDSVVPFYDNIEALPGTLVQMDDDEWYEAVKSNSQDCQGHIHWDNDSVLSVPQREDVIYHIYHAGFDPNS